MYSVLAPVRNTGRGVFSPGPTEMIRVCLPLQVDGQAPALGAHLHEMRGETMGTTWQLRWAGHAQADTAQVRAAVQAEFDLVVTQMSTWLSGSDLDRYNHADAATWQEVPPAFAEVMQAALQLADASCGAFNPAAGALVNLWGFGPAPRYSDPGFEPPTPAAVQSALARCDWRTLRFDAQHSRLYQTGGLLLDLSAIAKGYAVDRVLQRLSTLGLQHLLVEVGGELRGQGLRPGGLPWWVDLESPPLAQGQGPLPVTRLALHGLAVATSGDYRRVYTRAGRQLAHSVDPRTGEPITHGLASVSVVHPSCMWADGWSTALTVLGLEQGLALANAQGLAALFVQRDPDGRLREVLTPALQELAG